MTESYLTSFHFKYSLKLFDWIIIIHFIVYDSELGIYLMDVIISKIVPVILSFQLKVKIFKP